MKKTLMMGALALGCTTLLGSTSLLAQGSGSPLSSANQTPGANPVRSADMDKQFLMTASQSDYTEIKFSQLAADKANNARVKQYAQKMITDHQQLEAEMKPFADKLGVTPVTELDSDHQAKFDALSSMSGMEFDKTYMTGMDQDHHKSLDAFKAEETSTNDKDLKKTVAKGEKVVAQHTMMADKAMKMMGKAPASAGM